MSFSFPINLDSTLNIVTQAYEALKSRPEFAGSQDA